MLAHRLGQVFNASASAASLGRLASSTGFWQACSDVGVEAAYIVAPVAAGWQVQDGVEVIGVMDVASRLARLSAV